MRKRQLTEGDGAVWKPGICWHNCGGRCLNKVLVKDGKILRQKTDDTHPDSWEWPQSRGCLMGRALQQQIFGKDRLKYPMRRSHWEPFTGGERNMRGVDTWVRMSWDEALDAIAAELNHAYDTYGPASVFYMNMLNFEGYLGGVLAARGGYVDCSGTQSPGTFVLMTQMYGFDGAWGNDRMDLENSDYIVLYGHNAAWCAFGNPSYYLKHAKEAGCKFVFVGPEYSATAGFTDAEWIPVRPGTDTALLLGVAYSMIERDEDGSVIDWDFLNRCTVGFDGAHMPADARESENFVDYVTGASDGLPKTPAWASEICGTPVELIERFADIMGCTHNVSIHCNGAPARNKGAENLPQLLMTVTAMGGHFGTPGNACANDQYYSAMNNGARPTFMPFGGTPAVFNNAGNPIDDVLPTDSMWDAIVDGEYWLAGNNFNGTVRPIEHRTIDIHVIVSDHNNFLNSQANTNKGIEAFRKVDFVVSQAYYMKLDAQYADIVLPITTRWERCQSNFYGASAFADKENVFASAQMFEPMYECRSDREIAEALADRLGIDYAAVNPKSDTQIWFEQMTQAVEVGADGSMTPICTVTQEDIDRYGVDAVPQQGRMPLEEFIEQGVYRVRREKGDAYETIGYAAFRSDPDANPLQTPSGKMEIYSQSKSDFFGMVNGYSNGGEGVLNYVRVSPLPKYLPQVEGYEDSFVDWENKVRGPYPVQMAHVHYLRRAHTDCDSLPWLRESMTNPVFVNSKDAERRGIRTGDTVKVYNARGAILRHATVSRCVMEGVILVPHGASARIDPETGIDVGGADNTLTPSNASTDPFLNGWNSTLVEYERYDGPLSLADDDEMEPVVPVFA